MVELFHVYLYQPIFNFLILLYNNVAFNDIGIAIIEITIVIKLVLFPLNWQSIKSQKALQDIQPKLKELKEKFKDQKERLAQAMMELYKKEKVNPFSSCLPLLIQLPILWAVYRVFRDGLKDGGAVSGEFLYSFVAHPGVIDAHFLGIAFFDLSQRNILLAVITGALQFWQVKMLMAKKQPSVPGSKDEGMMSMMNKQMLYFMPIMTIIIGASLPSGLVLYWLVVTLFTGLQQMFMFRKKKKDDNSSKDLTNLPPANSGSNNEKKDTEQKQLPVAS